MGRKIEESDISKVRNIVLRPEHCFLFNFSGLRFPYRETSSIAGQVGTGNVRRENRGRQRSRKYSPRFDREVVVSLAEP